MEAVAKLEAFVYDQLKALKLPQLPKGLRTWVGDNVWWMAAALAVLSALSAVSLIFGFMMALGALAAPISASWYVGAFAGWVLITNAIALTFAVLDAVVLGLAVNPLKESQKKGWTFLFILWLLSALSFAVNLLVSVLTLNIFGLIGTLIFGTIFLAIAVYFLFEIRGEFAHVEKSAGVKKRKTTKTK
ncbi:hypothetical protein GW930_01715 [Candidatus Saccharibacteria bacterium]|nr:hypothetical protein [Candidatus Saccharibacteria bacterium]